MKSKVAQTCSVGLRLSLYLAGRIGRIPACRACGVWCPRTAIPLSPAIRGGRDAPLACPFAFSSPHC